MSVYGDVPPWAVALVLFLLIAVGGALFKIIWGLHVALERKVDNLQREQAKLAGHDDILVLAERIRADYMATQERLDDIRKMIMMIDKK